MQTNKSINRVKVIKNSAVVIAENEKCYYSDCGDFSVEMYKDTYFNGIFNLKCAAGDIKLVALKYMYERLRVCYYDREFRGNNCIVRYDYGNGAELWYSVYSDRLKGDLVINRNQTCYEYCFLLDAKDFTVDYCKNGGLVVKRALTGEVEYYIPAPFMRDAAGELSHEVYFEILEDRGNLVIKVVADYSFIDEEERVFPVTVDIQLVKSGSGCGIQCESVEHDVSIGGTITVNHPHILCVEGDGYGRSCEARVTFPLIKSIPEGEISAVYLEITCGEGGGDIKIGGQAVTVKAEEVKNSPRTFRIDVTHFEQGILVLAAEAIGAAANFYTYGEYAPKLIVEYRGQSSSEDEKNNQTEGDGDIADADIGSYVNLSGGACVPLF